MTDYLSGFRQGRRPRSPMSLLTSQLSPVFRPAGAGGCISSPIRPSERLRRDPAYRPTFCGHL
jgi:hypothetical protein